MHADAHFVIGSRHVREGKPCQDYATAADLPEGGAYAVVADGCSSGGETDIGSRIVARATAKAIREHWFTHYSAMTTSVVDQVQITERLVMATAGLALGCGTDDLLSTCAYVYMSPIGGYIRLQGDGVVAYKTTDGTLIMTRYDWDNNAPAYPAYQDEALLKYVQQFHDGDMEAKRFHAESWEIPPDAQPRRLRSQTSYSVADGVKGITIGMPADYSEYIAVFTDGVTQVENIDWQDVVCDLLAFKTTTGDFVKRRIRRMVSEAQKAGQGPVDDLACAVIHIPQGGTS